MDKTTLLCIFVSILIIEMMTQENYGSTDTFLSLTQCVMAIAKNDLNIKPTILIQLREINETITNKTELLDMMIEKISFNGIPKIITDNVDIISNIDTEEENILCIFITEDCDELEEIDFEMNTVKYIIIILGERENCKLKFQTFDKRFITQNVIIAFEGNIGEQFIFMNAKFEIDELTCNITDVVRFEEINTCAKGSFTKPSTLFLKKNLMDLKKCPLHAGIGELYPYMIFNNKTIEYQNFNSISETDIKGSDVELLKIMSHYFNATLNYYYIYKEKENPFVNKEFINLLLNGSLDICAGGLYRVYGDLVEYSGIYNRQGVVWAYSVEREIRSWESFVSKVNGLYIFLIFYVVHIVTWKLICQIDKQEFSLKETLLYSWGALVGTSSLQDARSVKQKIVNAMYLILSLHLSAYISVQLYSYLTIQSPPQLYRTIDELMESGIKPYLKSTSKYFINDKKYEVFANTSGNCDSFTHCQEVILERGGTTALIDGYMPIYQVRTAVNDEARVIMLHEEIIFVYHEMVMRKDIYFGDAFRKAILHLFEAGICKKLYEDSIGILLIDKANFAAKNVMSNSYSCQSGCKVTLTQSAGAFYIWIVGCILSCIVLIMEILVPKRNRF